MFQEDFKWLRVLKLEPLAQLVVLPTEIGNMVHLRYFSPSCCQINHLPSTMGNLVRMQTLDIHDSVLLESKTIANVISRMEELRHLYMPYLNRWSRRIQLSTLCKLQTLCHASSLSWDLSDLVKLASLRKLSIELFGKLKNLKEILRRSSSTLDGIRSLSVCNNDEIECAGGAREVREIVLSCRYVYKLRAFGPMHGRVTGRAPVLLEPHHVIVALLSSAQGRPIGNTREAAKLLSLIRHVFHESASTLVCSRGGFPRLENLFLRGLIKVQEWRVEEGAMPSLCRLHIADCPELKEVPEGLGYMDTL
ncbi:putative leucine-rich repeat domain, L domain-containing protein [Rosa chinensis]|uniref:Putative leucine-rich repeat domain, L domain-containing protein n=1 Tax=Rosa chinensis TaxID=74649 RepID=A0A2P6QST6_ROSCH|nr:putative leucine-rich repeat domain, L domain-containing protein [Rosa chinensis]